MPPEENPAPYEIEEMCLEIQKGWDETTRQMRRVYKANKDYIPWGIPSYKVRNLTDVLGEHTRMYNGGYEE